MHSSRQTKSQDNQHTVQGCCAQPSDGTCKRPDKIARLLQLAPLQVGILVNNVGVSYPHAEYYESIDDQLIDDLVTINIQATNKVCLFATRPSHIFSPWACAEARCHDHLGICCHCYDKLRQAGEQSVKKQILRSFPALLPVKQCQDSADAYTFWRRHMSKSVSKNHCYWALL